MAEFTDQDRHDLTKLQVDVGKIQEWRKGVDEKLDKIDQGVTDLRDEAAQRGQDIIAAVQNGSHSDPEPPSSGLSWNGQPIPKGVVQAILGLIIFLLGASGVGVLDFFTPDQVVNGAP